MYLQIKVKILKLARLILLSLTLAQKKMFITFSDFAFFVPPPRLFQPPRLLKR